MYQTPLESKLPKAGSKNITRKAGVRTANSAFSEFNEMEEKVLAMVSQLESLTQEVANDVEGKARCTGAESADPAASKAFKPKKLHFKKFAMKPGSKKLSLLKEKLALMKKKIAFMEKKNNLEQLFETTVDALSLKADVISEMHKLFQDAVFAWISRSLEHLRHKSSDQVQVTEDQVRSLKHNIDQEIEDLSRQPPLYLTKKNRLQPRMLIILSNLRNISSKASKGWLSLMKGRSS